MLVRIPRIRTGIILLLVTGALSGCSATSDDQHEIAPETMATDLGPEEVAAVCADTFSAVYEEDLANLDAACNALGVSAALGAGTFSDEELREVCFGARDACLAEEIPEKSDFVAGSCEGVAELSRCRVTVGELQDCLGDSVASRGDNYHSPPDCAELTYNSAIASLGHRRPASCSSVYRECEEGYGWVN